MIDTSQYKKILDSGLLLDHYIVLCSIKDGSKLPSSKRVTGFINLLHKKEYLKDNTLTEKAIALVGDNSNPVHTPLIPQGIPSKDSVFTKWVIQLYVKCQNRLLELTGRKQVRDKIQGKSYPFLPNSTDLGRVLLRTIKQYKLDDLEKIEKCIMSYINKCSAAKQWFPVLNYYIMKDGSSRLVTDLESVDEDSDTAHNASIHIV